MTKWKQKDWEVSGPCPEALHQFALMPDEKVFPNTYSGVAWRAAYRIWKATKDTPNVLDNIGPYENVPGADLEDLDLTGFMVGWAVNVVRQMLGKAPGGNGAIVTVGVGNEPYPSVGPADLAMRRAIGGK